jgi:hypothetical protein
MIKVEVYQDDKVLVSFDNTRDINITEDLVNITFSEDPQNFKFGFKS